MKPQLLAERQAAVMTALRSRTTIAVGLLLVACPFAAAEPTQHQPVTLDFELPPTSETASENPFLDYQLQARFTSGDQQYDVPGFYAADGDAAESGADRGGVWRVIFTPPSAGQWDYIVSFRRGPRVAIDSDPRSGEAVAPHDGSTGQIDVLAASEDASAFARSGRLVHPPGRYYHSLDGKPLLLTGTNSPENFLACKDFDGTYSADPDKNYLKTWGPHDRDARPGDPTWRGGRGKGILGALNYLASQGMNVAYVMTLTLEGDACDVWPFLSHERSDFTRYDVSKLAQWDRVFSHAERLGIVLELVTQEQENQLLLDDGFLGPQRKLYYRELVARFGYHNNLIWNLGEENGPQAEYWPQGQNDQQRIAAIRYVTDIDPYEHPVVIHTYAVEHEREPILGPLLRYRRFDGISLQSHEPRSVHGAVQHWVAKSAEYDHPWVVMQDENGPWHTGTKPDSEDPDHDELRREVLWGALMGGAAGVQWYFGWLTPPHDLNAEDWRSRENMWKQTAVARRLFDQIDYPRMASADELLEGDGYCLSTPGESYLVYLKRGGAARLDLGGQEGEYAVRWYNPRVGGALQRGSTPSVGGGGWASIGAPPTDADADWAALVTKVASEPNE